MPEPLPVPWKADDPLVSVTITEPDTLSVRMFGVPYPIPPELGPLTRASFGPVMDYLHSVLRQPFTVEVFETDGTRHTGVIDLRTVADTTGASTPAPRRAVMEPVPPDAMPRIPLEEAAWVRPIDQPEPDQPETVAADAAPLAQPGVPVVDGFRPGEQVALWLLVATTTVDADGVVRDPVPSWLPAAVMIVGQDSGVIRTLARG